MLELHLGRPGVCLIRIETATVLLENHLDAISDATDDLSRFCPVWRRQIVEGERTIVRLSCFP